MATLISVWVGLTLAAVVACYADSILTAPPRERPAPLPRARVVRR